MAEGDFTQPATGDYPSIGKGFGALSPAMWDRMMNMLEWFEGAALGQVTSDQIAMVSKIARDVERLKVQVPYIFAKITGSASLATNRYKYAWTQVGFDGDSPHAAVAMDNPMTGTTSTDYAMNLCEIANTATDVGPGVNLSGANYPSGFSMRAIGDSTGTDVQLVVPMFQLPSDTGTLQRWFALANASDGTC
jgi:hypothetical protein